jgi:oligopeptide transport system permease protein
MLERQNIFDGQGYDIPESEFEFVQTDQQLYDSEIKVESMGFFKDGIARLRRNKASVAAFWIISAIVVMAIIAPSFVPYTYREQNPNRTNMTPRAPIIERLGIMDGRSVLYNRRMDSLSDPQKYPEGSVLRAFNERVVNGVKMVDVEVDYYKLVGAADEYHWLGTDYLGRDLWARLWRGARVSLVIAFVAVSTNICIGIVYGAIAGYYGGATDMIMMRVCEILNALPEVVVVTMFILLFGAGMTSLILALVIRGWIPTARMIRAQFLRFRGREYVLAARTLGVPDRILIFRHILPNSIGPIITESFLAFIGLGLPAPEPSIGVLLSDGQKVLLQYPHMTLYPALLISILMIAFNMFANGLRDAFDPTQRGQE